MGSLVAEPLFCTVRLVTADVNKNCLQQNYNNEKNKIYEFSLIPPNSYCSLLF